MQIQLNDHVPSPKGFVRIELIDDSDTVVWSIALPNVITYDAGLILSRLVGDSRDPSPARNNGITMLAVGTGATGRDPNNPDRPRPEQRALNRELVRKPFSEVLYRDDRGRSVSYVTRVRDFVTIFGTGEAVGPINEMALIYPASPDPTVQNPIIQKPLQYDPTVDVAGKDLLLNYFTFGVINKPRGLRFKITWRVTF